MNDSPIVKDTRKVRSAISHQFGNNVKKYIASLRSTPSDEKTSAPSCVREEPPVYPTDQ